MLLVAANERTQIALALLLLVQACTALRSTELLMLQVCNTFTTQANGCLASMTPV